MEELKGVNSPKIFRKLVHVERNLKECDVTYPSDERVNRVIDDYKKTFPGGENVQGLYIRRGVIGYDFAISHRHYKLDITLLQAIKLGNCIYLSSYIKNESDRDRENNF